MRSTRVRRRNDKLLLEGSSVAMRKGERGKETVRWAESNQDSFYHSIDQPHRLDCYSQGKGWLLHLHDLLLMERTPPSCSGLGLLHLNQESGPGHRVDKYLLQQHYHHHPKLQKEQSSMRQQQRPGLICAVPTETPGRPLWPTHDDCRWNPPVQHGDEMSQQQAASGGEHDQFLAEELKKRMRDQWRGGGGLKWFPTIDQRRQKWRQCKRKEGKEKQTTKR